MTYHNIPLKNILRFIKEANIKIILKKNNEEKIKDFFEFFQFLKMWLK
jgi:hypothetical protein